MQKIFNWQRYWYKDENSPHIIDGFLYVHEYTRNVFTLDSVADVPCLVLRGEPGMGKSSEIERIYENFIEDENNEKFYFNLSTYGEENRLVRDVFESERIKQWKEGKTNLYLFLDSLDEALLNINTLALLLADEIGKFPEERLFVRIACRTAEWSNLSVLENKLKEIWKEDKCQILQIAPLQQKDVEIAVKDENLDAEKFIVEIYHKNVTALASKPVTLQFLLNLFDENESFPSNQTQLYEKGCLALCEEKNLRRKASKRTGDLTPEKRFVIAARIAALMIFGNKSSIWIGGITGEETSDILISDLSGYTEKRKDGTEFQITEDYIREVLSDTGLFTNNGNNRLKFSHQTFAEFLASWYLECRRLSDEIVIKLIGKNYLYPQLYETSAWISNQRKSIFQHLMKIAPATLLRSDILLAEDSTKAQLVEILLDLFDKEEAEGIDRFYYRKLNHPKLAEQIRPYIVDKSKGWLVRTEAIDMAQICKVEELQNDFTKIALDKTDDQNIRVRAVYAIDWIGDSETKRQIRPLVFGKIEDDERFRLKGAALYVLWNEHLTAKELFSVLSPPNNHIAGSYESFLDSQMVEKLQTEDLPVALDWLVENMQDFMHRISSERRIADEILLMAWDNLDDEEIFVRFIKVVKILISKHKDIFKEIENKEKLERIFQDDDKRHKVWLEIFSSINDNHYWSLDGSKFICLRNSDIDWLTDEWEKTTNKDLKEKLLSRLKGFFSYWGTSVEVLDDIYRACNRNEKLKKEFEEIFAPVKLNSEKAKKQKESYEESTKWRREDEKEEAERNKPVNPSPMESSLISLGKIEKGKFNSFIELNYQMMFLPNGWSEKSEFESDLTKLPVWKDADENVKKKIIKAAKEYIKKGNPQDDEWIGSDSYNYSALSGYKALVLLNKFEPEFIGSLQKNIWEKWAAIIYHYPRGNGDEEYEMHLQFVAKAYKNAPNRIIELLKREIERDEENESYWSFEKLKYCWDERLKTFLKGELENVNLSVYGIRKILSELFELNDIEIGKIACNYIKFPIPLNEKEQQILMTSIELLITHGKINCWEKIWQILENDVEFGRKIVEFGVSRFGRVGIQDLSEKQTSDLFVWLSKQYPHKEDPVHYGIYTPGARDEIVRWRDSLLGTLREKGTVEAVEEIKKIKEQFPNLEWLKFTLLKAEEKMREMTWEALEPESLLKFILGISLDSSMKHEGESENTLIVSDIDDLEFNEKFVKQNPFLRELLEDYKKNPGKFVFFTGAGLSAGVFPMWKALLHKMIEYCFDSKKLNQQENEEISEMLWKEEFLDIASICKEKLGITNYEEFLRREFSKRNFSSEQVLAYRQLFKMKPKTVITTNFDLIPDEIANIRSMQEEVSILDASSKYSIYSNLNITNAQKDLSEDKPIVFKMHGCINAGGIVFTQEDFRKIIYGNSQIRNFLNTIFTMRTVIFLGFGLSDPHIDSVLSCLWEINKGMGKPHYILINDCSTLKIQSIEKKYEIRVINYTSTNGHPQVLEFLEILEKARDI